VNSLGNGNGAFNGNNTFTGNENVRFNSWANFDLATVSGVFASAQLELLTRTYPFNSGASYVLDIYDVSTSLSALASFASGVTGYNDLSSGSLYGSGTFGDGTIVVIPLSVQALNDINAAIGGTFRIGFINVTLNGQPTGPAVDVGIYTNGLMQNHPRLILTAAVPEPSTLLLLGSALTGFGFFGRRKKAGSRSEIVGPWTATELTKRHKS
jgi:hypothetical protein